MVMRRETTKRVRKMTERAKARRRKKPRGRARVKAMSDLFSSTIHFRLIILKY